MQFASGLVETDCVIRVYDINKALCALIIMAPERSQLILAADIPNSEGNIVILNCFDIEANRWDGFDYFAKLHHVEQTGQW